MKKFGLIGYPLTHSFSEKYFAGKFRRESIKDCVYQNYPIKNIRELPGLIADEPGLAGLNVTIPYKEAVLPFLDHVSGEAAEIGAVNTVRIREGKTEGFNTDVYGFTKALEPCLKPHHSKALVLGSGGASKAVCFAFNRMGLDYSIVSRHPQKGVGMLGYEDLTGGLILQYTLIINTTPLGMFPDTDTFPPIPYDALTPQHLLFDLVYNPEETLFMKKGKAQGAAVFNGLEMLKLQAERSWEIWNG
ncbi:MAG: shikimate dehydrogenase [Chlorobi bacterium]|nr:shikimate dehydrogenase [Chlorobiota bacterium]